MLKYFKVIIMTEYIIYEEELANDTTHCKSTWGPVQLTPQETDQESVNSHKQGLRI
jgi:hypothetical protein